MSLQIAGFDGIDFEPGAADQVIHLAIKVTASAHQLPIWRQTMLPPSNADFRREAVLDENQSPARPENPPHDGERRERIRDRAQGPGHHDGIEYRISNGQVFRRGSEQRYRSGQISRPSTREPQQFG